MFVKNTVYAFAAAAALAVGTHAPTASADGCTSDFNVPTAIAGQTCRNGTGTVSGTAIANRLQNGARIDHQVRLNAGGLIFGMLLNGDGARARRASDGLGCPVSQDSSTPDGSFGPLTTCFPISTTEVKKIRLVVN